MRIFVGLSFGSDNETAVCGVADNREEARRCVELVRHEMLHWAREATDGPDGGAGLDDNRGDLVGRVLAFDVAGTAKLRWEIVEDMLSARSICIDTSDADNSPLLYSIFGYGDEWTADFDGRSFAHGTLEECMSACRKSEDNAILQAIQNQQEHDESWPKPNDYVGDDKHGRLLWLLKRMLNPEDLGMAVPAHVRDEVREVLGMKRCEK